jgi:hypothetical protein
MRRRWIFGKFKVIRAVSMDGPIIHEAAKMTRGYRVKRAIEIDMNG